MNVAHIKHVFVVSTSTPSGLVRKGLGFGPMLQFTGLCVVRGQRLMT